MTHTFKVGDTGLTRGGMYSNREYEKLRYEVIYDEPTANTPLVVLLEDGKLSREPRRYFKNGTLNNLDPSNGPYDLMPPEPPKQTFREWYVRKGYSSDFDSTALCTSTTLNSMLLKTIADYLDEQARKE